jgi:hypothetical protein
MHSPTNIYVTKKRTTQIIMISVDGMNIHDGLIYHL